MFCGKGFEILVKHHWYQPPNLEEHTVMACQSCNSMLTRDKFSAYPLIRSVSQYSIVEKARELIDRDWEELKGIMHPWTEVTHSFMQSEYEKYRLRYMSPPQRLLDKIQRHIPPTFTEQLEYIKHRKGQGIDRLNR